MKNKSDIFLIDAWRSKDEDDTHLAWLEFQNRYQRKLENYNRKVLPNYMVDDVIGDIWAAFFDYVLVEDIKIGVEQLLFGIAKNKRADAVEKLTTERAIEDNSYPIEFLSQHNPEKIRKYVNTNLVDFFEEEENLLLKSQQLDFLYQIPYTNLLSPGERVFWVLRQNLGCRTSVVSKITGKSEGVIAQTLYRARKNKVGPFLESAEFDRIMARKEMKRGPFPNPRANPALVLERFANPIVPRFTPDELEPLGITNKEFNKDYVTSLILPWQIEEGQYDFTDTKLHERERKLRALQKNNSSSRIFLVLTSRSEYFKTQELAKGLIALENAEEKSQTLLKRIKQSVPSEALFKATVYGNDIVITHQSTVEIRPVVFLNKVRDFSSYDISSFISTHSQSLLTPIDYFYHSRKIFDLFGLPKVNHRFSTDQLGTPFAKMEIQEDLE